MENTTTDTIGTPANVKSQDIPPIFNDFFKPVNEMDPLVRAEGGEEYIFGCKLYNMNMEADCVEYCEMVNKCLKGGFIQGIKKTHFTKEGDMLIYFEWMEVKKTNPTLNEVKDSAVKKGTSGAKENTKLTKTKKKEKKKAASQEHYATNPVLPFDLTEDPTAGLASLESLEDNSINASDTYTTEE